MRRGPNATRPKRCSAAMEWVLAMCSLAFGGQKLSLNSAPKKKTRSINKNASNKERQKQRVSIGFNMKGGNPGSYHVVVEAHLLLL